MNGFEALLTNRAPSMLQIAISISELSASTFAHQESQYLDVK